MSYCKHIAEKWISPELLLTTQRDRKAVTDAELSELRELSRSYLEMVYELVIVNDRVALQHRRAEFTRAALTGILANPTLSGAAGETIAHSAVRVADATLARLRDDEATGAGVAEAVRQARRNRQLEAVAEYLYGHPRAKAVEWGKADKFDGCYERAAEIIAIVEATPT